MRMAPRKVIHRTRPSRERRGGRHRQGMAYREPAVRPQEAEEPAPPPPRATFRVCHRSVVGLSVAGLIAAATVAWAVYCVWSPMSLLAAFLVPTGGLAFAFHLSVGYAAEVDLVVEGLPEDRAFRVTLRRRWSFLPWTRPLVFRTTSAPQLMTQWDTGSTSSKGGPSREYELARLALKLGEVEIRLPAMRGARDGSRKVIVVDHAPAVHAAKARYLEEVQALRDAMGRAKVAQRESRKRRGLPGAAVARAITDSDPSARILVASSEGGFDHRVAIALALALAIAGLFGLTAYLAPQSSIALACGGLAAPLVACSIALAATSSAYGHTHQFRRQCADHTSLTTVRDLFLFGPLGATGSRKLAPDFGLHVKRVTVGEEESVRYDLVDAQHGTTLFTDSDEKAVRRFGEGLGGRIIESGGLQVPRP